MTAETARTPAALRLIGRFRLKNGDGATVELVSRRARALLAYLALAPERTASRERLCGLLWSDRGEPQARASLRQCLLELRGVLAAAGLDLLDVGRESVTLAAGAVEVDVDGLTEALSGGPEAVIERLGEVAPYHLLDDFEIGGLFGEWRAQARERLDRAIAESAKTELAALESGADWAKARALAEAYLQRDRLDETIVASAIRADMALGSTGSAHRRYQSLEADLLKELGVRPGPAVREALGAGSLAGREPIARTLEPSASHVTRPSPPLPDRPSIAVLPFRNLSGDPEQEYFADAMTEDIVAALSRWRWFFVIAWDTSFAYKNRPVDPDRVGEELGVRYLLEGSIRKAGDRVRISARLTDAIDGSNVWTDRFDRDVINVLDLQDEITEQVAASIEPAMLRGEGLRAVRKPMKDFDALDFYYKGMWHLHNMTDSSDLEALELFKEVMIREPGSPLGFVGTSRILYGRAVFGGSPSPGPDLNRARDLAATAIALDPRDAQGYYARSASALYLGDHAAALGDARRAVEINPNFALGHARLGQVLVFNGAAGDAIEPIQRSLRLSPYDPQLAVNLNLLALAYYQSGLYEEAALQARAAMNHGPLRTSLLLAASLAMLGRLEEARAVFPPPEQRETSPYQPLAPRYLRERDLEHLREGVRLARSEPGQAYASSRG